MFDKLSCEDTPEAAQFEAYFEAHAAEDSCGCGAPSEPGSAPYCSDLCRDEAEGSVDWNANEG
jgi:hypothetical protein